MEKENTRVKKNFALYRRSKFVYFPFYLYLSGTPTSLICFCFDNLKLGHLLSVP